MSAMKNLDLLAQQVATTPDEYDEIKTLISMHMQGQLSFQELPIHIQSMMIQWENDELELRSEIEAWDNYLK